MSTEHDIALVPVAGELTVRSTPALKRVLDDLVERGTRRIVLNMADVPYVDSAGMGAILSTIRRMRAKGGVVSLINVCPDVLRTLKIARLVDVVSVSEAGQRREVPELSPQELPLWRTTLPVSCDDLHSARKRIEDLAGRLSFSRDEVFDITLAVGEALGNAVDHTCGSGVLATVSAYADRLVVEITDCGCGFSLAQDERTALSHAGERGRGIQLMRLLVDSVSIEERAAGVGTSVKLVKLVS